MEYHEEFQYNHQISKTDGKILPTIWEPNSHSRGEIWKIQGHKVATNGKGMRIIEMVLFLTETTNMIRTTEIDISRCDLTRDTTNSTLQIIIIIHTDLLL